MIIQDDLKHNHTISKTIGKLQTFAHSLKYANKLLPRRTLRDLYYTQAYPHLIGNITVWGTAKSSKMYIKPLATLQKKLIRLICNVPPRTHTAPLMQQLKTLNIYNLYTYRTACHRSTQIQVLTTHQSATHRAAATIYPYKPKHAELHTAPHIRQPAIAQYGTPYHQASEKKETLKLLKRGCTATF